jgi:hypothetical protein
MGDVVINKIQKCNAPSSISFRCILKLYIQCTFRLRHSSKNVWVSSECRNSEINSNGAIETCSWGTRLVQSSFWESRYICRPSELHTKFGNVMWAFLESSCGLHIKRHREEFQLQRVWKCSISTSANHQILVALMMETARASETSVDIQLRTRQYIPEDSELRNYILLTLWSRSSSK